MRSFLYRRSLVFFVLFFFGAQCLIGRSSGSWLEAREGMVQTSSMTASLSSEQNDLWSSSLFNEKGIQSTEHPPLNLDQVGQNTLFNFLLEDEEGLLVVILAIFLMGIVWKHISMYQLKNDMKEVSSIWQERLGQLMGDP